MSSVLKVSIATLEDMKVLYGGFDLCSETTSVSMTINGPAPIMVAMYFNTAMDQAVPKHSPNLRAFSVGLALLMLDFGIAGLRSSWKDGSDWRG